MEINGMHGMTNMMGQQTAVGGKTEGQLPPFPFPDKSTPAKSGEVAHNVQRMVKEIDSVKQKMDFEVSVDNLQKYRELVKGFLDYYVDNALTTKDFVHTHDSGYRQKLTVVEEVKEGLEELDDLKEVLDTEQGHLEVMARIGELNGMIVDLSL